jgi:hypothetical protein
VIGNLPAAANSGSPETSYSFTDNNPAQNSFYRIAEYGLGGTAQYSGILRSACNGPNEVINIWPNPVRDKIYVNIVTGNHSQAVIKMFDSKGALLKIQTAPVLPGTNRLSVDVHAFANGMYQLLIDWNNGQSQKTERVLKQ